MFTHNELNEYADLLLRRNLTITSADITDAASCRIHGIYQNCYFLLAKTVVCIITSIQSFIDQDRLIYLFLRHMSVASNNIRLYVNHYLLTYLSSFLYLARCECVWVICTIDVKNLC